MKRVTFTFFESFHHFRLWLSSFELLLFFPENCVWASWTPWSACSESCGSGSETRSRTKTKTERNGGICSGSGSDSKTCNRQPCPGKQDTSFVVLLMLNDSF